MKNIESSIHWRPLSAGIVMVLLIALFALNQFNFLQFTSTVLTGCVFLSLSLFWNVYVLLLARSEKKLGWNGEIADGLLLAGMVFVFLGVFF
jgi:hypothetical protein